MFQVVHHCCKAEAGLESQNLDISKSLNGNRTKLRRCVRTINDKYIIILDECVNLSFRLATVKLQWNALFRFQLQYH